MFKVQGVRCTVLGSWLAVLVACGAREAAAQLTVTLSPTDYNGHHISCFGARDGAIDAELGDLPDMNTGLPYVFKADSLGQFSCLSRSHPVQLFDLFPTDSSFTLTSIDGGEQRPAFVTDTVYPPIIVYDGCNFTTHLPPAYARSRPKPTIRPNPNTGRFTVQFTDPLVAETYYSVYDAMGKLLFQRPLPKGRETEEVDLSRFGAGTYVIKLTDPEGSRHERVVLE